MNTITYELAKERMADRLRDAEHHRLVQQAKAAARDERGGPGQGIRPRDWLKSWLRLRGSVPRVPNGSITTRPL
jgi:hypothetical protein